MSWLNPKNEDDERLRNFLIYKIPATNREIEDMAPLWVVVLMGFIIIVGLIWLTS